jgi:branched-chain amino acid transport system permease protein
MNLCAIFTIFAVTFNLIYGYTGQFSLGHAGFAAIGAYTAALLTMTPEQKGPTSSCSPSCRFWPNVMALPAGHAAGRPAGHDRVFLIGTPALRLRGDYLAIATLGFGEIIRVMFVNWQPITNGSLGLKGIPEHTNLYWSWGAALITIFVVKRLVDSSYGRALKAVRDDEIAAEALGVGLFYHKILAFSLSSLLRRRGRRAAGQPDQHHRSRVFLFFLTYQIVGITVMGGMGSLTGCTIAACLYTVFLELLRPIESPFNVLGMQIPGVPGMRMVLFSILLLLVILFYRKGVFGGIEFSWDWLFEKVGALRARLSDSNGTPPAAPALPGGDNGQ